MTVWPVIVRELRAEARRPFNYWLRLLGAGALLLAAAGTDMQYLGRSQQGLVLFQNLQQMLLIAIWVLVPLVTADCISRERREGTLGLLFLTPLRAHDIVAAKSIVQALRALTACVAVLPVQVLPFLMGGVTWQEAVLAVLINLNSFFLALAAGILASSFARVFHRALVLAAALAFLFFLLFIFINGQVMVAVLRPFLATPSLMMFPKERGLLFSLLLGMESLSQSGRTFWPGPTSANLLRSFPIATAVGFLVLLGVVMIAALRLRKSWQEKPPSVWQRWSREQFCTPLPRLTFYHGWLRRHLERNPVGWLEQRTWQGRLAVWGWVAAILCWWWLALSGNRYFSTGFSEVERFLGSILLFSMGITSAISFWRDREKGTLELMLVTPLSERRIIWGRLRAIWGRYLPAVLLFIGLWAFVTRFRSVAKPDYFWISYFALLCATLPVVGLFFSLHCRNLLVSGGLTLLVGLVLPKVAVFVVPYAWSRLAWWVNLVVEAALIGGLVVVWKRRAYVWAGGLALGALLWFLWAVGPELSLAPSRLTGALAKTSRLFFFVLAPDNWERRYGMLSAASRLYTLMGLQLVIATVLAWRIHRNLATRRFGMLRVKG